MDWPSISEKMNSKILVLLVAVLLLLMPVAYSYAVSGNEYISMKDNASVKKNNSMNKIIE